MEIWKPLRNFPNYNVSSEGRIMNIRTGRILKTYIGEKGYAQVCLRKNNQQYTVKVHTLVAETFLGEHPGMVVSHRDLNRSKDYVDNLEWRARADIIRDAFERGSKIPSRRIQVRVIETNDVFDSIAECARSLNCCRSDISKQLSGKLHHVKGYHFEVV